MLTMLSFSDREMVLFLSGFFFAIRKKQSFRYRATALKAWQKVLHDIAWKGKTLATLPVSVAPSITRKLTSIILVKQGSELELKKVTETFKTPGAVLIWF